MICPPIDEPYFWRVEAAFGQYVFVRFWPNRAWFSKRRRMFKEAFQALFDAFEWPEMNKERGKGAE